MALMLTEPELAMTEASSFARVFVRMLLMPIAPAPLTATPAEPPIATPAEAAATIALMFVRETSIFVASVADSVSV